MALNMQRTDQLVLAYCKKRGLVHTEHRLRQEAGLPAVSITDMQVHDLAINDGILQFLAGDSPRELLEAYIHAAEWVDNCLDIYKAELGRVLYPLFVHAYLDLIAMGAKVEAQQLMSSHSSRFLEAGTQTSKRRQQELQDLQSIAGPEHMLTNRTAQAARSQRYPVRLTQYAATLLMHFLQTAKLYSLLGILNKRVRLQAQEGLGRKPSAADADGEEEVGLLAGSQHAELQGVNTKRLTLGLLADTPETRYAEMKADEAVGELPTEGPDGKLLTKKAQQAAKKAAEKRRAELRRLKDEKMRPEIPLLPLPDEVEAQMLHSIEQRASVSPEALPSAVMLTFVNTHHALKGACASADGALVAGGFADSSVRVYDLAKTASSDGAGSSSAARPAGIGADPAGTMLWGHSAAVYAVDFAPAHDLLFSASGDGSVRLWSLELAANLVAYKGHMLPVWDVASSPHGLYFASASADRTCRVWSTERAAPLRILAGHQSDVDVVRWHPNSHYVATGSSDCSVRLWDMRNGSAARIFLGHEAPITSLTFSPDGSTLMSGSQDGSMMAWDLQAARRAGTMAGHTDAVWSMSFSQGDGSVLASGGADNTLRLWSTGSSELSSTDAPALEPYQLLRTFKTKATPVFHVSFTRMNLLVGAGALTLRR